MSTIVKVQKYGLLWTPLRCVPSVVSVPSESPRTLWAIRLRTETLSECFFGPLQYVQNHLCGKRYLMCRNPVPTRAEPQNMSSQHRLWSGVTCNPPEKMQTSFEKLVTKTAVLELSFENSSSKLQFWSWVLKTRHQNCSFIVEFSKLVTKTAVLMTSFEKCHQKKIPSSFAKLVTKTAVL